MEMIKKIKQAEAQAQQIIDQAKAEAAARAEAFRTTRQKTLEQAEQERRKAIDAAVAAAEIRAKDEVEKLAADAEALRRELRAKSAGRIPEATARIVALLKG